MKKISAVFLAIMMLFAFAACDGSTPADENGPKMPEAPISERYPDSDYTKTVNVKNAAELTEALNKLESGTKIVLAAGEYDMKDSVMTDQYAGQGGWMFLVNEENVAIVSADDADVTIFSTDETPNGALATQDMITVVADDVVLAGLKIGTRHSDNKAVDVIGNNVTIDSCTFIDGAALYIAEYDQTEGNTIDKATVQYSTFEKNATVSITSGVSGDIRFSDNTFENGSSLYLTGSRDSGWNPTGIDVSSAVFTRNAFEAGSMLRLAYDAEESQNDSLASLDPSVIADNFGAAAETVGDYGETIKFFIAN